MWASAGAVLHAHPAEFFFQMGLRAVAVTAQRVSVLRGSLCWSLGPVTGNLWLSGPMRVPGLTRWPGKPGQGRAPESSLL